MAHFAKLGVDNIVTDILHVDTIDNMTSGGIEKEEIGIAHLTKHHGHENWRQCSINTLRGEHLDGKKNHEHKLWSLIQFNSWYVERYK